MSDKAKPDTYKQSAIASRWLFAVCIFSSCLAARAQVNSLNSGTVIASGENTWGQSSVPPGLRDVIAIAAGQEHSLALRSGGTVVCWGDNRFGQLALPSGLSGVISISAGGQHSLALKKDGAVVAWGHNELGQSTVPAFPALMSVTPGSRFYRAVRE